MIKIMQVSTNSISYFNISSTIKIYSLLGCGMKEMNWPVLKKPWHLYSWDHFKQTKDVKMVLKNDKLDATLGN